MMLLKIVLVKSNSKKRLSAFVQALKAKGDSVVNMEVKLLGYIPYMGRFLFS